MATRVACDVKGCDSTTLESTSDDGWGYIEVRAEFEPWIDICPKCLDTLFEKGNN